MLIGELIMRFIEYLSSFVSITGVSLITIFTALFPLLSKRLTRNRFYFTKKQYLNVQEVL